MPFVVNMLARAVVGCPRIQSGGIPSVLTGGVQARPGRIVQQQRVTMFCHDFRR
jgi:hypothetical protein